MFNYGFLPTELKKKELLNLILDSFVLYSNGKVELRFKVPVDENQVSETVLTLLRNDTTFGNRNYDAILEFDKPKNLR